MAKTITPERPVNRVYPEYLGDIDAGLLLSELTNTNPVNSIDEIRVALEELRKNGGMLTVTAEFKLERVSQRASLKKLVRLVVAPDER